MSKRFLFCQQNIGAIPDYTFAENDNLIKPRSERLRTICKQASERNYDFITFNEVWDGFAKDYILSQKDFVEKFPYHVFAPMNPLWKRSGLAIFSKYPIVDSFSFSYPRHMKARDEVFIGKGGLLIKIQLPDIDLPIVLGTTHLQAGGQATGWLGDIANWFNGTLHASVPLIRQQQQEELMRQVFYFAGPKLKDRIILVGDWNTRLEDFSQKFLDEFVHLTQPDTTLWMDFDPPKQTFPTSDDNEKSLIDILFVSKRFPFSDTSKSRIVEEFAFAKKDKPPKGLVDHRTCLSLMDLPSSV